MSVIEIGQAFGFVSSFTNSAATIHTVSIITTMLLLTELINFFNISQLLASYKMGGIASLLTPEGMLLFVAPIVPVLLCLEVLALGLMRKLRLHQYKTTVLTHVLNVIIGKFLVIDALAFVLKHLDHVSPFKTSMTCYWFIYSYVVWEFSQFVFHYSSHKIRLLWCTHAPHHTPEHINLTVAYSGFFLQAIVAYAIRCGICIVLGVSFQMLMLIILLDGAWGGLLHVSEEILPDGRLGFLKKWIMTPQHHRIHHSRNPEYIDKNFCNFLSIWDHVFRTYQKPLPEVAPDYGIARKINANSFIQMYFSEFYYLFLDIKNTKGLKNKLLYPFMPPGWHPQLT